MLESVTELRYNKRPHVTWKTRPIEEVAHRWADKGMFINDVTLGVGEAKTAVANKRQDKRFWAFASKTAINSLFCSEKKERQKGLVRKTAIISGSTGSMQ